MLLPNSRNSKNEIFVTSLLEEINILSPVTFFINADVNGKKVKYIFQEDLRKEFLESKNLIEGPILEGDERFTIDNHKKTYRDDFMKKLHLEHPQYQWKNNKGYPTKSHRAAIKKIGVSQYHRKSFRLLPEQLSLNI